MGQKRFSSERKRYHLRIRGFFSLINTFSLVFPVISPTSLSDLEGWPEALALHTSPPYCILTHSSGGRGIPHLLLQPQLERLSMCTCITVSEPQKVELFRYHWQQNMVCKTFLCVLSHIQGGKNVQAWQWGTRMKSWNTNQLQRQYEICRHLTLP